MVRESYNQYNNAGQPLTVEQQLRSQLSAVTKERDEAKDAAWNNLNAMQVVWNYLIEHDELLIIHEGMGEAAGENIVESIKKIKVERDEFKRDAERLDCLEVYARDMDDFERQLYPNKQMWVFFADKGVQGDTRRIIDAAMSAMLDGEA